MQWLTMGAQAVTSTFDMHDIYMFVDLLNKVWQTAYVTMNGLSQPACISKHERGRRQFAVAAYYVLTRQQYIRKVCYHYGPRIDLRSVKVWCALSCLF